MPSPALYLVRHTAVAAPGLCYGHHDVPLADTFAEEAAATAAKVLDLVGGWENLAPARVVSSPAARCRRLAVGLRPFSMARTLQFDERLRELHFGRWENRPWAELPAAELNPWMADYVTTAPPEGESFAALHQRTGAFLAELAAEANGGPPVVAVTHAGVVRSLLCHALDLPLGHAFRLNVDFGSVSLLKPGPAGGAPWQVGFVNR